MTLRLRILLLEDQANDAELLQAALEHDGFACDVRIVSTRAEFEAALDGGTFDVILSDYALPSFDGLSALRVASQRAVDTPFILVSGTIGEEAAIESLRTGATDYVLKHRLFRLGPAVRRALDEAKERQSRREAETALRDSEQRYRSLFLGNPHPMWVYDRQTLRFLAVNQAAVELYGYSVEEFLRMRLPDIRPHGEDTGIEDDAGPRSDLSPAEECRHVRKDGGVMTVEVSSHTLDFAGRDAALVLAHDVTGQRQLEAQFRQAQKMEAIGRLAGGVAHDFNNILTAILGHSQMLSTSPELPPDFADSIAEIEKATMRATSLTRQLLAFSRQQVLQPRVVDVNALILDMHKMLARLIGEDIDLLTAPGADLGRIQADPGQLEQVILNLVVNARDAMPEGGKLTIETDNVRLDDAYVRGREGLAAGPYVRLSVTDSGLGMDADTIARIFEPFFTTKELGRGTGLGLSTVHGIVKQSGGHVEVYSEVGRGTTFKVYLPSVEANAHASREPSTPSLPARGSETVLVIEDDDLVRKTVTQALRRHGYQVLEAMSRTEALESCERARVEAKTIDLVLTDVIMPGMGVAEMVERLRVTHPVTPIVYMSGYTDRAMAHQGLLGEDAPFLQKPFTIKDLLAKVHEHLKPPQSRAA